MPFAEALSPYFRRGPRHLMGIGYAGFLEENCNFKIDCRVLIFVGEHDKTGKVKKYCEAWNRATAFALRIIPEAAHNSNYDNSEAVNREIDSFLMY